MRAEDSAEKGEQVPGGSDRQNHSTSRSYMLPGLAQALASSKRAEVIAAELRRRIVRHEINEGDQLPTEAELTVQIGVSRPTLREAFRVLESEGLVKIHRGVKGGARIQKPQVSVAARYVNLLLQFDGATVEDIYALRLMLEPPAAGMLAAKGNTVTGQLREALAIESVVEDPLEHSIAATSFHKMVVDLIGNPAISIIWALINEIVEEFGKAFAAQSLDSQYAITRETGMQAHLDFVEFVEQQDTIGAESHWRQHLTKTGELMLADMGAKPISELLS